MPRLIVTLGFVSGCANNTIVAHNAQQQSFSLGESGCTDTCDLNATCIDAECVCNLGFMGDGLTCDSDSEDPGGCELNPCPDEACVDTNPGYTCTACEPGFVSANNICSDVDECLTKPCRGSYPYCENTVGSFQCYGVSPIAFGAIGLNQTIYGELPPELFNATAFSVNNVNSHITAIVNGTLFSWGTHFQGPDPALDGVSQITSGYDFNVALKNDGSIVTWGYNMYNQLDVPIDLNAIAISSGVYHTLALKSDSTVVAWGDNWFDQSSVPPDLNEVIAISTGIYHSLALKADGSVVAWGCNDSGQGIVPEGLSNVSAIASGDVHNVALKTDGTVIAWGYGEDGETTVPDGLNAIAIAAGGHFSAALKADGTVITWGAFEQPSITDVVSIWASGDNLILFQKVIQP